MKLTIFAATGGIGRHVLDQALAAGHEVTAVVRNPNRLPAAAGVVTTDPSAADPGAPRVVPTDLPAADPPAADPGAPRIVPPDLPAADPPAPAPGAPRLVLTDLPAASPSAPAPCASP